MNQFVEEVKSTTITIPLTRLHNIIHIGVILSEENEKLKKENNELHQQILKRDKGNNPVPALDSTTLNLDSGTPSATPQ